MFRLIESIQLKDGVLVRLPYHQQRMDRSIRDLVGRRSRWSLSNELERHQLPTNGLWKVRVLYNEKELFCEHEVYLPRAIRSLKVIHADEISYSYKFQHRDAIAKCLEQRGDCDDVLIIKEGLVTDSSYANIVFWSGYNWVTPETCLLPDTMRQFLLDEKRIRTETIRVSDIKNFQQFRLINALLGWNHPAVDVSNIH